MRIGQFFRALALLVFAAILSIATASGVRADSSSAAAALNNQTYTVCGSPYIGTTFSLAVQAADATTTGGSFVLVDVLATNIGRNAGFLRDSVEAIDERGQNYVPIIASDNNSDLSAAYESAVAQLGVQDTDYRIQIGQTAEVLLLFGVPASVQSLQLFPADGASVTCPGS